jgi:hypothetical protein
MAQTLKYGNGIWANQEGSSLAYNDENGNYKPLPFSFERDSIATRVNKEGLIEVVNRDMPRIDYTDTSDGVLLLENAATNYSAYSELTSTWTYTEFGSGSAGTITTGKTDMFGGTNAVQIDFPTNADNVAIRFGSASSSLSSGDTSVSVYIKLVEIGSKDVQLRCNFTGLVNVNSTEFTRVDLSGTKTNSEAFNLKLRPSEGTSSGGFSIIICHPQEENNSYPTSYIPTSGSTVTRAAETANGSGNSEVFNDSEGVLFADISALNNDLTNRAITISDKTSNNRIFITYYAESNGLFSQIISNGVTQATLTAKLPSITNSTKVLVKYKQNDFALWVNGFEVSYDENGVAPIGLDDFSFDRGTGTLNFYGKTKELGYYDTALTDEELEYMTSYRSLNELVTELNLNTL